MAMKKTKLINVCNTDKTTSVFKDNKFSLILGVGQIKQVVREDNAVRFVLKMRPAVSISIAVDDQDILDDIIEDVKIHE